MKRARFFWKSTCSTCRDARRYLVDELGAKLEERDYAKASLDTAALRELFADRDPRDFLNPRSPAFKARGLAAKSLSREEAIRLMADDSNLIKRPLLIVGTEMIAGFDRDRYRRSLG